MRIYVKNASFPGYENDIRALVNSFYPGAELVQSVGVVQGADKVSETDAAKTSAAVQQTELKQNTELGSESSAGRSWDAESGSTADDVVIDLDSIAYSIERNQVRFEEKTNLKRALYGLLSEKTGRKLPWGTLTGIRPVRIREMLEEKELSEEEIHHSLKEDFLISDTKIKLLDSIAHREKQLLDEIDYKAGCSIYIGIPFCPTRCLYCSFTSNPVDKYADAADRYIEALCNELDDLAAGRKDDEYARFDAAGLKTLYIGGGTPTALSAGQLEVLLDKVRELFGIPAEYTVEAGRPDSITKAKLEVLKSHGVGRISVNPQTFNQKTLDLIGRKHTVEQTVEAYELARSMGFDNINMDLIMGLPGEDIADVKHTLGMISRLAPDSLTVHTLAVKRASRLQTEGKAWGGVERKGSSLDIREADELAEMTALGAECAAGLGMNPYYIYRQKNMAGNQDNVGYARPGCECLYNILMMEEKHTVYGIGAGASTKIVYSHKQSEELFKNKIIRRENVKNLNDYLIYSS